MKLRASAMAARIWSAVRPAPSTSAGIGGSTQRLWANTGVALANKAAIRKMQRTRPSFGVEKCFDRASVAYRAEPALGARVSVWDRKPPQICQGNAGNISAL